MSFLGHLKRGRNQDWFNFFQIGVVSSSNFIYMYLSFAFIFIYILKFKNIKYWVLTLSLTNYHLCVCIYKGHSVNKVNFAFCVGNSKHFLHLNIFQENQLWWAFSCHRKLSASPSLPTGSIIFFIDFSAGNFFFTGELLCFLFMN